MPRGHIIRRAGRVDRRPLRHLQGARALSVRPHHVLLTLNPLIYRVHASAFPARALSALAGLQFSSLFGSVIAPLAIHWRSTRRGTPRPCPSVMPGACISRVLPKLGPLTGSGATARVRRPTLTTLPSSSHTRSQFPLPLYGVYTLHSFQGLYSLHALYALHSFHALYTLYVLHSLHVTFTIRGALWRKSSL